MRLVATARAADAPVLAAPGAGVAASVVALRPVRPAATAGMIETVAIPATATTANAAALIATRFVKKFPNIPCSFGFELLYGGRCPHSRRRSRAFPEPLLRREGPPRYACFHTEASRERCRCEAGGRALRGIRYRRARRGRPAPGPRVRADPQTPGHRCRRARSIWR